jgi:N-methylhydantoinase A
VIIGVDVGGTFTDFVIFDPRDGTHRHHKLASTPGAPGDAVIRGLGDLGIDLADVERLIHGTTVATNTIIQRAGAVTGLIASEGHRDMLEIRRGTKPEHEVFNTRWSEPIPLVPRRRALDVKERLDARGRVVLELDARELELAVDHLVHQGVEAVAVCFLFSYMDDVHERRAKKLIADRHPALEVSTSAEILPQWREYERAVTTVADAYVKPAMKRYLGALQAELDRSGYERDILVMRSNGGVMTAEGAQERPIETFLSGPAGGVVAGLAHGREAGLENLVVIDVGGTSFDVSLVTAGRSKTTTETLIDPVTPLSLAMLDIRTIGAGGGSIAWVDPGGALKVGPHSAGAHPGPACYGFGGEDPTLTDANVLLGRIGAESMLGGRMPIEPRLAEESVRRKVGDVLGLDAVRAAYGIIRICVANMVGEIRAITAERGVDPAGYALLAGGGAGPLHAALIARELGIGSIIVPSYPGLLSAGGLIVSDLRIDRLRSFRCRVERDGTDSMVGALDGLVDDVTRALRDEGYSGDPVIEVALDMKYAGQNWEITVPVGRDDLAPDRVVVAFDRLHEELYGFAIPGHPHEVLSLRAAAIGPIPQGHELSARRFPSGTHATAATPEARTTRSVWDEVVGNFTTAGVFVRDELGPGAALRGPCLVEGMDAVVWIPSDCVGAVRESGTLVVSFDAVAGEAPSRVDA